MAGEFSITMKCVEAENEPVTNSSEKFYQLSCFIEKEVKYIHTGLKGVSHTTVYNHNKHNIVLTLYLLKNFVCFLFLFFLVMFSQSNKT